MALYALKAFEAAANSAPLAVPALDELARHLPSALPVARGDFGAMAVWQEEALPGLRATGHGPDYLTDVQEGECLVFTRDYVHGTLTNGEDWSALINFM